MPVIIRGDTDPVVEAVVDALRAYQADHPEAEIEVYRRNDVSVRVRVIDPGFTALSRAERSKQVWPVLRRLSEEVLSEVSLVILVSPVERATSFASLEFDHPVPSAVP